MLLKFSNIETDCKREIKVWFKLQRTKQNEYMK